MTLFKNKYRIESTRLKGWDYSSAGWYFVTFCTRGKECFFGDVVDGEMRLSPVGEIACQCWIDIPKHSPSNVALDAFVVMPNHVHGIIVIQDSENRRDVACNVSTTIASDSAMAKISPRAGSLGAIVRSYKSAVTRWARSSGFPFFAWQERFHDEIVRDEPALDNIRKYIIDNPAMWNTDRENPAGLWM
jgi:putative transposase